MRGFSAQNSGSLTATAFTPTLSSGSEEEGGVDSEGEATASAGGSVVAGILTREELQAQERKLGLHPDLQRSPPGLLLNSAQELKTALGKSVIVDGKPAGT